MTRRRFIVDADDLAVQMPAGKVHYPQGTPVELDDQGVMFPFIADKLRDEDLARDQRNQAAIVLTLRRFSCPATARARGTSRVPVPALRPGRCHHRP